MEISKNLSSQPIKEVPSVPDVSLRRLNPEIPGELALARAVDLASPEAYNPEDGTHDSMDDIELKEWHREDELHMLRYVTVDPQKFKELVDAEQFHQALNEAENAGDRKRVNALLKMEEEGIIGFTYIYNDSKKDLDFKQREEGLRGKMNIPAKDDVCEMNFWYVPGTKDAPVEQGTQLTLNEFTSKRTQKTTTVMFVDSSDIGNTARELIGVDGFTIKTRNKKVSDRDVLKSLAANKDQDEKVKNRLQDTRILSKMGFEYKGEMMYSSEEKLPSWMYVQTFTPAILPPTPSPAPTV